MHRPSLDHERGNDRDVAPTPNACGVATSTLTKGAIGPTSRELVMKDRQSDGSEFARTTLPRMRTFTTSLFWSTITSLSFRPVKTTGMSKPCSTSAVPWATPQSIRALPSARIL